MSDETTSPFTDRPPKSMWRAWVPFVLFALAVIRMLPRNEIISRWPSGVLLITAGVTGLIWRREFAAADRQVRKGTWYQMTLAQHRWNAWFFGVVCIVLGAILMTTEIGTIRK